MIQSLDEGFLTSSSPTLRQLSIEEKRGIIYSSVLRFAPEAIPLRERVLDRVVMGGLLGSSKTSPYRASVVRQHLAAGDAGLSVRIEAIEQTLTRLVRSGRVTETQAGKRHSTYFLTDTATTELNAAIGEIERLFTLATEKAFVDTKAFVDPAVSSAVFRKFVMTCFARSGQSIARSISGAVSTADMTQLVDVGSAFREAIADHSLSAEQRETVELRCKRFLSSHDAVDERLRYLLVQGYYFTQLLGLEGEQFNPLVEQTFAGSTLFLDTNVLIVGLIPTDVEEEVFVEVIRIARRAGITLKVTRATLNELLEFVRRRIPQLERILPAVPIEVVSRTSDPVIRSFLQARERKPGLTPKDYLLELGSFEDKLTNEWEIAVDERDVDDILADREVDDLNKVLQEEAVNVRGSPKHEKVLAHDVAAYCLVNDERSKGRRVWFLTRDGSLSLAAKRLTPEDVPFCLEHVAFLQSISPFVQTSEEEFSFVDVFASLMSEQFRPAGAVFDAGELTVLAEFHEDVLATPADRLIPALDYVKTRTLHGKPYTETEIPRVSLELKKFLASDREEQVVALRDERQRLQLLLDDQSNQLKSKDAELGEARDDMSASAQQLARMQSSLDALSADLNDQRRQLSETVEGFNDKTRRDSAEFDLRLANERAATLSAQKRGRAYLALGGIILGAIIWWLSPAIAATFDPSLSQLRLWREHKFLLLNIAGAILFSYPLLRYIGHETWSYERKLFVVTVVLVMTLLLSNTLDFGALGGISDLLGVTGWLAAAVLVLYRSRPSQ